MFHKKYVNFAEFIWEDFSYQIDNRQLKKSRREIIPYPRFTKVIINHFLSINKSVPKAIPSGIHSIKDDGVLSRMKFVRIREDYGNSPREALHPLRWVFDETRANVKLGQVYTHVLPLHQGFSAKARDHGHNPAIPLKMWDTPTFTSLCAANPHPMISPAFVEANYEVLESLLREWRKQIHNEDLQTELEYLSEDSHAKRKSGIIQRIPKKGRGRVERNAKGGRPSEPGANGNRGHSINLPPLLAAHLGRNENGEPQPNTCKEEIGDAYSLPHVHIHPQRFYQNMVEQPEGRQFVHGLRTRNLVEFLSTDLPTTYKGLMEKTYTWIEAREMATNGAPNDQNYGHDTNQYRELRYKIEEAMRSGHLDHLVKGIKKGKAKVCDTQLGEWKKGEKDKAPVEAPILMISKRDHNPKKRSVEENYSEVREITFPLSPISTPQSPLS
ncbi:hypothetical protein Tco_0241846 [Tanacetum coccineum]